MYDDEKSEQPKWNISHHNDADDDDHRHHRLLDILTQNIIKLNCWKNAIN